MAGELMQQAMKEGIDFDGDQNNGQPEDASIPGKETGTATTPEAEVSKPADGAAKPAETEKELPFHKHPKWKQMNDENRSYKERLEAMEQKYQQMLEASLFSQKQTDNQNPLAPEQKQALLQLVRLIKSDPEAAQELGLGSVTEVQEAISNLQSERVKEGFWGEFDGVTDRFASTYGIPKDELQDELQTFLQTDPVFSSMPYSKGNVEYAAQVMLFGRLGEMKEREINSKLLKEKQQKASNNTESQSKDSASGAKGPDLSMPGGIMQRIKDAGGLSV